MDWWQRQADSVDEVNECRVGLQSAWFRVDSSACCSPTPLLDDGEEERVEGEEQATLERAKPIAIQRLGVNLAANGGGGFCLSTTIGLIVHEMMVVKFSEHIHTHTTSWTLMSMITSVCECAGGDANVRCQLSATAAAMLLLLPRWWENAKPIFSLTSFWQNCTSATFSPFSLGKERSLTGLTGGNLIRKTNPNSTVQVCAPPPPPPPRRPFEVCDHFY